MRTTVSQQRGVPWAGRTWPHGSHVCDIDAATARDLAKAPPGIHVEWMDGPPEPVQARVTDQPVTSLEMVKQERERANFFQARVESIEAGHARELKRLIISHRGELDTLRAEHAGALASANALAEQACNERDRALEQLALSKSGKSAEGFVPVVDAPAPVRRKAGPG